MTRAILLAALLFCCTWSPAVLAFESARADDDAPVPEGPAKDADRPRPAATSSDDDELLKAIDPRGGNGVDEEIERMERVIEGMRKVRERIARSDTSSETQKVQEQVIKDLEALLKLLKNQQRRKGSSQQRKASEELSEAERERLRKDRGDPNNSDRANPDGSADPSTGRRSEDKSTDSQERSDAARQLAAEEARRARMIKDVWGHLPPHVRERIEKSFSEKYLPKYEELVKKYYESLAEKNRKSPAPTTRPAEERIVR